MLLTPERTILVTNPKSSRAADVQRGVLHPLQEATTKFETLYTKSPNAEDNISDIAEYIRPGDRIIVASGDGVAHQVANAILQSDIEDVTMGALAYGGFNDVAATFTNMKLHPATLIDADAQVADVHPLEIHVDEELYRYAILYSTMGWTALVAAMMEEPELRSAIQRSNFKLPKTLLAATSKYFKTRNSTPFPDFTRKGHEEENHHGITDILSVNGPHMGGLIRSGQNYYERDDFFQADLDVSRLPRNINFLGRSAINLVTGSHLRLPGHEVTEDTLYFNGASFGIQHEGEVQFLQNVTTTRTAKSKKTLRMVTNKK